MLERWFVEISSARTFFSKSTLKQLILILGLTAVAGRFVYSGIWKPLKSANIEQVWEEFAPLRHHLDNGTPLSITNPRQYGPVFFMVCEPLWIFAKREKEVFSRYLYMVGLLSVLGALWCFFKTIEMTFGKDFQFSGDPASRSFIFLILACLWLGSSPLLYILNVKNVETWELFLISLGLYFRQKDRFFWCGFCIAAATLIKILPVVFMIYFFLCDRKAFVWSLICLVGLLVCFTFHYGPEMGILYPSLMAKASVGNTWGVFHMENISIKGYCLKVLFGWRISPTSILLITPGKAEKALMLAHAFQILAGFLWLAFLLRKRAAFAKSPLAIPWEWSWVSIGILVLSPQTAFEYAVLAQGAFSFCAICYLLKPRLRSRFSLGTLILGIFLVLNLIPRSLLNHIFWTQDLNYLLGNSHLTPSEGYQLYGLPLFGFLCFLFFLIYTKIRILKE